MAVYEIAQSNLDELETVSKNLQVGDEVRIVEPGRYRIPVEYTGVTKTDSDYKDRGGAKKEDYSDYDYRTGIDSYYNDYWYVVQDARTKKRGGYDYLMSSSHLPKSARMICIGSDNPRGGRDVATFVAYDHLRGVRPYFYYQHGTFNREFAEGVAKCFLGKSIFQRQKQVPGTKLVNASGGKVSLVYESRFDKYKDGYVYSDASGVIEFTRDTIADGMSWGLRGDKEPPNYQYLFGGDISSMDYLSVLPYGAYMPYDEAVGFDFEGNGMRTVCGHNHFITFQSRDQFTGTVAIDGFAFATIVVLFDGWYSSPRKLTDCTFTGCRADLSNTEWFEHCTFDNVTTQVVSPNTTLDYKAVVNRCTFRNCKNDKPVVEAPIVLNSVFNDNECGFPAIGMSINCAFVDNKPASGKYHVADALSLNLNRAFVVNSYLFSNTFFKDDDTGILSKFFKCVHDDSVVASPSERNFDADSPGLQKIDLVDVLKGFVCPHMTDTALTTNYRKFTTQPTSWIIMDPITKKFIDVRLVDDLTKCVAETSCAKSTAPSSLIVDGELNDPIMSVDCLLGKGIRISEFLRLIDKSRAVFGSYMFPSGHKIYNKGVISPDFFEDAAYYIDNFFTEDVLSAFSSDINGRPRYEDFISIGPVETAASWSESLVCVVSTLRSGFGKVTPGVQFVKRGTTASVSVLCTGNVTKVEVNSDEVEAARRIVVNADRPVVTVDVYASNDLYVDAGSESVVDVSRRNGSKEFPFIDFEKASFMLCLANTGRYSLDALVGNSDEFNGVYSIDFSDAILENELGSATVHVRNGEYSINLVDTAASRHRGDTVFDLDDTVTLETVMVNESGVSDYEMYWEKKPWVGALRFYGKGAWLVGCVYIKPEQKAVFDGFKCHGRFASGLHLTNINYDMSGNTLNAKSAPCFRLCDVNGDHDNAYDSYKYVFNNCSIDCGDTNEHGLVLNGVYTFCDIVPSEKTSYRGRFMYCNIHDQHRGPVNAYGIMCSGSRGVAKCTNCVITNCAKLGGGGVYYMYDKTSSLDKCLVTFFPDTPSTAYLFPAYSVWSRAFTTGESRASRDMSHDRYYTELQKTMLPSPGLNVYGNINFHPRIGGNVDINDLHLMTYSEKRGTGLFSTNAGLDEGVSPIDVNFLNYTTYFSYRGLGAEPAWYDLGTLCATMTDCVCDKTEQKQPSDKILDVELTRMRTGAASSVCGNGDTTDRDERFFKCLCAVIYGSYVFNKTGMTKRALDLAAIVNNFVRRCMLDGKYLSPKIIDTVAYVPVNDPAVTGGKKALEYLQELQRQLTPAEFSRIKKQLETPVNYTVDVSGDMCHIYDKYGDLTVNLLHPGTSSNLIPGKHTFVVTRLAQLLVNSTVFKNSGAQFPAFRSFTFDTFRRAVDFVENGEFKRTCTTPFVDKSDGNKRYVVFCDEMLDAKYTYTFIDVVAETLGKDKKTMLVNGRYLRCILFPDEQINSRNGLI